MSLSSSWAYLSGKKTYLLLALGALAYVWGVVSSDFSLFEAVQSSPLWQLALGGSLAHKLDKASA